MSVRLGISAHQPDKMLEQMMAVLRTGTRHHLFEHFVRLMGRNA
jgi:hypothetical protein